MRLSYSIGEGYVYYHVVASLTYTAEWSKLRKIMLREMNHFCHNLKKKILDLIESGTIWDFSLLCSIYTCFTYK